MQGLDNAPSLDFETNFKMKGALSFGTKISVIDTGDFQAFSELPSTQPSSQMPSLSLAPSVYSNLARKVKIEQTTLEPLHLTEVQIFDQNGNNVALNKNTTMSSIFSDDNGPFHNSSGYAVDGLTGSDNFFHTGPGGPTSMAWWEVDLANPVIVSKITIYNRQDCRHCSGCFDRLSNARVSLIDSNGTAFDQISIGPWRQWEDKSVLHLTFPSTLHIMSTYKPWGPFYIQSPGTGGKILSTEFDTSGSCKPGNKVLLNSKSKNPSDQWIFHHDGTIESLYCCGMVLDIDGDDNSCADGLSIVISKKMNGRQKQQWSLHGDFLESRRCQDKGVDIANYPTSPRIELWTRNNNWNQDWHITGRFIEFDPISVQLSVDADLMASVGFGLVRATLDGDAELKGSARLVYCPDCSDRAIMSSYQPVGSSSFYYQREFGYELSGGIGIASKIPGMGSPVGALRFSIADDNVFDDIPPVIGLPSFKDLLDSIKFTPQRAVGK